MALDDNNGADICAVVSKSLSQSIVSMLSSGASFATSTGGPGSLKTNGDKAVEEEELFDSLCSLRDVVCVSSAETSLVTIDKIVVCESRRVESGSRTTEISSSETLKFVI